MLFYYYRKWQRTSLFILVLLFIFCLEFLIYFVQALTWQKLKCPSNSKCTRILFVADPQILGELDESNWITIWDNDRWVGMNSHFTKLFIYELNLIQWNTLNSNFLCSRYLHHTFMLALSHIQPDAVVFLGDLMDEGSRANDFEFKRYVNRFFNIFPLDHVPKVGLNLFDFSRFWFFYAFHSTGLLFWFQSLFLPGDNDIGGENGDPILPSVVYRFRHIFHKTKELLVNLCLILKVKYRCIQIYSVRNALSSNSFISLLLP